MGWSKSQAKSIAQDARHRMGAGWALLSPALQEAARNSAAVKGAEKARGGGLDLLGFDS